jgi:hypothetical protein
LSFLKEEKHRDDKCGGSRVLCVGLEVAVRRICDCMGHVIRCFVMVAACDVVGLDLWRRCRSW